MTQVAVYRFFDSVGELLYVGMSRTPMARFSEHILESFWFEDIRTITIAWYPDREAATLAEANAIASERPAWNTFGTWDAVSAGQCGPPCEVEYDPGPPRSVWCMDGLGGSYKRIHESIGLAERRATVAAYRRQGVPCSAIAARLGISLATVYNDLRKVAG